MIINLHEMNIVIFSCIFMYYHASLLLQELSLRIEHLTEEAQKKRHALDNEVTETLTAQVCVSYFCLSSWICCTLFLVHVISLYIKVEALTASDLVGIKSLFFIIL